MRMTLPLFAAVVLASPAASAQEWNAVAAPSGVLILATDKTELGRADVGPVRELAVLGKAVYAALAQGGVAVIDVTDPKKPSALGQLAQGRTVARLFVDGGALFLVEVRNELSAYSLADPLRPSPQASLLPGQVPGAVTPVVSAPPPPPTAPSAPAAEASKVIDVVSGRVIFDAGPSKGFAPGKRVKITSQQLVLKPDLETGGLKELPSNEVTAVLQIEHAEAGRSMAPLGRGDIARPGDLATLTDEPVSERTFLPRRAPFTTRAGFHLRPFLGLETDSKPFGLLLDAFGAYYFEEIPFRIEVGVAPFGTAFNAEVSHYPTTAAVTFAYTTDFFEIGLGLGALVGHDGPCGFRGPTDTSCEKNTGVTINQTLRLGSLDGLNVSWQSSIFSRPESFVFGVGRVEVNVPITSRLGLFGAGGGGENGWNFGEGGVRTYVGGTGARGTTIISASLGYASVFDGPAPPLGPNGEMHQNEHVGGPSVAFGMEWRL